MRFLVFVKANNENVHSSLQDIGATQIIERAHTDKIELDFNLESSINIAYLKLKLNEFISLEEVLEDFSDLSNMDKLNMADTLIREERFWEVHNLLEDIWKSATGSRKLLLHDVIGIIVSQIKVQMNQWETGENVYARNIGRLKDNAPDSLVQQLPEEFCYPLKLKLSVLLDTIETS